MPDADGVTWSAKEVFADLKADLTSHLDKQDTALLDIRDRFGTLVTKADLQVVSNSVSELSGRVTRIEDERKAEATASQVRSRFRTRAWAVMTAVAVPIGVALILVFLH